MARQPRPPLPIKQPGERLGRQVWLCGSMAGNVTAAFPVQPFWYRIVSVHFVAVLTAGGPRAFLRVVDGANNTLTQFVTCVTDAIATYEFDFVVNCSRWYYPGGGAALDSFLPVPIPPDLVIWPGCRVIFGLIGGAAGDVVSNCAMIWEPR